MTNDSICLNCQKTLHKSTTFADLFLWRKIKNELLCDECFLLFEKIDFTTSCQGCCKPDIEQESLCSDCAHWESIYPDLETKNISLFKYTSFAKEWMIRFKLVGDVRCGMVFNKILKDIVKMKFPDYIIIPIPSSEKSLIERGFNQIHVLIDSARLSYSEVLINNTNDTNQSQKTRTERLLTSQPFEIKQDHVIKNKKLLIIDDVYTTGRTVYHAKKLLYKHGAKRVDSLTIFR